VHTVGIRYGEIMAKGWNTCRVRIEV